MITVEFLIKFLSGIAVFLLGMKIMSEGLEKAASNKMRELFGRVSNNRFSGLLVGTGVTAAVQSSTATTVMVVGLVNAGVLTLFQATNIIMGANIGTTVTGLIIALESFDITIYLLIPVFLGIFTMMFSKKETPQKVGTIITGIGLIFLGLHMMSEAVDLIKEAPLFIKIFNSVENPILLMLIGMIITAIVQSSSAVNVIIILLAVPIGSQNGLDIVDGIYIVLGTNVGTCLTALLASINTSTNAKRTAVFHLLFNVIGTLVFAGFFMLFSKITISNMLSRLFGNNAKFQIAWFNFFQNLICSLLLIPFSKQLVTLTTILVKDKPVKVTYDLKYIDNRYLVTPAIAIGETIKEVKRMFDIAYENYLLGIQSITTNNISHEVTIQNNEKILDELSIGITDYLIKISSQNINPSDEKYIANLFHIISDIERIGDHSVNLLEYAMSMYASSNYLSVDAINELCEMNCKIAEMFKLSLDIFETKNNNLLCKIIIIEEIIDTMKIEFSTNHIVRLNNSLCTAENGMNFYGIVTDLERVADHLMNIAELANPSKIRKISYKTTHPQK